MGWHLLETLLQQVGEHATLVGKLWVTATFVFRFIIVASVGDAVYSDEQSDFYCNTETPGCKNVCFNQFNRISHLRFWAAQIIAVCTPSIIFVVYATHVLMSSQNDNETYEEGTKELVAAEPSPAVTTKGKRGSSRKASTRSTKSKTGFYGSLRGRVKHTRKAIYGEESAESAVGEEDDTPAELQDDGTDIDQSLADIERQLAALEKQETSKTTNIRIKFAYVIALFLRTGSEAVFVWLQYILYGFEVPEIYHCDRIPCQHIVDCFVSRPTEKTLFLWFMFVVSCICLLLNIIEIKYLGLKKLAKVLCSPSSAESDESIYVTGAKSPKDYTNETQSGSGEEITGNTNRKYLHNQDGRRMKSESDSDSIGFSEIGKPPPYPITNFPLVHRYGLLLNSRPPPTAPHSVEVEKSYL